MCLEIPFDIFQFIVDLFVEKWLYLKLNQERQSCIMSTDKVSQELFLKVKQKLDYYCLPTSFPIEATPLLNKLINLIGSSSNKNQYASTTNVAGEGLSNALKHEMGKVVKQNNKLHMDLICAREQIQSLEHSLYKINSNKHSDKKQLQKLAVLNTARQQQLLEQLRQTKFKYNQLMDFLHEDPAAEREYIKRLMKHKHMNVDHIQEQSKQNTNKNLNKQNHTGTHHKIRELQSKILNREAEILRLQGIIQYDGINMNKVIKNFNDDLAKKQLQNAHSKIDYLQQSYTDIKKQNSKIKSNNGSKQALRAQVQRCHSLIQKLKLQNSQLKRQDKQRKFDVDKKLTENGRKIRKIQEERDVVRNTYNQKVSQNNELNKKINFLQKQGKQHKIQLENLQQSLNLKSRDYEGLLKKNEELKLYYQYELETYKNKLYELETQIEQIRIGNKQKQYQINILKKQSSLKTDSINNLEKIVNQLIRKNNSLAQNPLVGVQQSFRRTDEEFQNKRLAMDLQQQLIYAQNQKVQMEVDLRELQHRYSLCSKENDKYKLQYGHLRGELLEKQSLITRLSQNIDELKHLLKKQQNDTAKVTSQLNEVTYQKDIFINDLKLQNQRLSQNQKSLRTKLRDLQIKNSEEQGVWEVTRIRLQEKQERIKYLEKLLNESVQQSRSLSSQLASFDQANHELVRQKQRISKKYDQLMKEAEEFKANSFKNYEISINNNLNQVNSLENQILNLRESEQRLSIRYEQIAKLLDLVSRQKELLQVNKIAVQRENQHLKIRLLDMQQNERRLVIQNQNLRNYSRRV